MATPTTESERSSSAVPGVETLQQELESVARRMRLFRGIRFAARGVLAGSVAALAFLALSRFGLLPLLLDLNLPLAIVIAYALGMGAGLVSASTRKIDRLAVARYAEQQLGLKERLSSALTLEDQSGNVLVRLQRSDAARHAGEIEPRVLVPWRLTWELPAAIVSVLLVLLAALLPVSPLSVTAPDRAARVLTAREGSKLEEVARQILQQSDQTAPPPVKEAARHLQQIARAMQAHNASRTQAVHDLQKLSDQIKQANQKAAGSPAPGPTTNGADKSAQARADAQRALERDLSADANGDRPQASGAPPGKGSKISAGSAGTHSGNAGNLLNAGNSPTSTGHGTSPGTGSGDKRQNNGASAQKQQSGSTAQSSGGTKKNPSAASAPRGAQIRKGQASSKPGAVAKSNAASSKPGGSAAKPSNPSSKPGPSSQTSPSGKSAPTGSLSHQSAQNAPQSQGSTPNSAPAPKSGKDFGKDAPKSGNQDAGKPAISGQDTLGNKLRQYADKIAQRPMASGEREQAAKSLDQLNQKLDDAKMHETQKHVQAAAQALREGRQQDAVSELRQAADAADRETPVTERQTTSQSSSSSNQSSSSSGSQSSSRNGASQQMQRAVDQSKQNLSGQQPGQGKASGQGQQLGQGQSGPGKSGQQDSPGNGPAGGSGKPNQAGPSQSPKQDTAHVSGGRGPGARFGSPRPLSNLPKASGGPTTIALKPSGPGGRMIEKPVPGKETPAGASSIVPYYRVLPQFKKAAEKDAGAENIPPAYRQQVRKYFDSLTPPHK